MLKLEEAAFQTTIATILQKNSAKISQKQLHYLQHLPKSVSIGLNRSEQL